MQISKIASLTLLLLALGQCQATKQPASPQDRPSCQPSATLLSRKLSSLNSQQQQEEVGNSSKNTGGQQAVRLDVPSVVSLPANQRGLAVRPFESTEKLRQLRQLLNSNSYDAYLVGPNDEHGSEYVTEFDRRLRFLSGFTGSNGYALLTAGQATLFTDGRYALQAELELDCNWGLVVSDDLLVEIFNWLKASNLRSFKLVTDARLMTLNSYDYLEENLKTLDSELTLISRDLLDVVWDQMASDPATASNPINARPRSQEPLFVHPAQYAGNVSWQEKLVKLADKMSKLDNANHYIISQLDDIAWLLNTRGNDIPDSPLFKAYLFVSRLPAAAELLPAQLDQQPQPPVHLPASQTIRVIMYVDLNKVSQEVREHLQVDNGTLFTPSSGQSNGSTRIQLELKDYEQFVTELRARLQVTQDGGHRLQGRLLLDSQANVAIHVLAKAHDEVTILQTGLVKQLKAVKSEAEVDGMRRAHLRDSLAISMLLSQLDHDIGLAGRTTKWTEVGAASELELYRSLMDLNKGQSFDSISAYGSNAAIIHYAPKKGEHVFIGNQSTYLLDCGGQYLDGTTDITRTMHFGEPTEFQRETYTRVLMGSIDLMSLIFFQPTRSPFRIPDMMARRHLFDLGLDYDHGTGHGIGVFSLVHESPNIIEHYQYVAHQRSRPAQASTSGASKQQASSNVAPPQAAPSWHSEPILLQSNMFTSVEPGYYKANDFGIRLENIVVTRKFPHQSQKPLVVKLNVTNPQRQILRFEPISLVPFEPKLIKQELLSNKQKSWLNSYNLLIRIRLTTVINHYLEKIRKERNSQPSASNRQAKLTSSQDISPPQRLPPINNHRISSRQFALGSANTETATTTSNQTNSNDPLMNFVKMDLDLFQEKLERTHRWIMAKTELIPLDLPQSLTNANTQSRRKQQSSLKPEESLESQQKLMLAYMAGAPFNDQKAIDTLRAISENHALSGRADNMTEGVSGASNNSISSPLAGPTSQGQIRSKCLGAQCDLMLLESINSGKGEGKVMKDLVERNELDPFEFEQEDFSTKPGSLLDLFKVDSVHQVGSVGRWVLVGFGTLFVLQIVLTSIVCRRRTRRSSTGISVV